MNVGVLKHDARSNKWMAIYAGKILASSSNKEYVIGSIKSGRCAKANTMKVTDVQEANAVKKEASQNQNAFSVNERFEFLNDFVGMVADRVSPSLVVTGEGGLGKTYTVNNALQKAGLKNSADLIGFNTDSGLSEDKSKKVYSVVKGYSTAKGLYRTLYENRNRIVVFDDCDSVLRDFTAIALLKAALDSYDKRIISWNAESFGDDGLPRSFEFKGGVIFISNYPIFKIDQAVRTRAICVDLTMSASQKIERMHALIKSEEFMPEYDIQHKQQALNFLDKMKERATELSLRSLISVTKIVSRGGDWEKRAEYLLTAI